MSLPADLHAIHQQLFELATDALFVHDENGIILDLNEVACLGLKRRREECVGLAVWEVDASVPRAELERIWADVRAGNPLLIRTEHRRFDGTTFPVEVRVRSFHSGGRCLFIGSSRDITASVEVEERLRRNERRLSLAISATADAVWEWEIDTNRTVYSPRWYEILGYEDRAFEMTLDTWRSLCHPDDLQAALDRIDVVLKAPPGAGYEAEFRMRHSDGAWRWILGRGNVVERDQRGRPLLLAGTNTDITRQKRADEDRAELEANLAQSRKLDSIGRLAGGIAHDFNNMLTVIAGNVAEVRDELSTADPLRELLTDAMSAVDSAADLTRQLLTYSRRQVISPRVLNLNLVVGNLSRMLERVLGEDLALTTSLAPDLGNVRLDPGQLEQILVNLCFNARDAMQEGGRLTIETRNVDLDRSSTDAHPAVDPGAFIMLAVSDTGVGMSEAVRLQACEPFFTTKAAGKGTGLGLAMVYGAIKQNQGVLEIYSEPGRGTTFKVYFQRIYAVVEPMEGKAGRVDQRGHERVAIVEDQQLVRELAVRVLSRAGYDVRSFASGNEFLESPDAATPFDLVVTDVVMPGMNGRELADRLRARHPHTRVIFASGYTENVILQGGDLEPGVDFIAKPYTAAELTTRARQALDRAPATPER